MDRLFSILWFIGAVVFGIATLVNLFTGNRDNDITQFFLICVLFWIVNEDRVRGRRD